MSDAELDRLLRVGGSRLEGGGRNVIPPGEDECAGRRALLCRALDEYRLTPVQRAIAVRVALGECNRVISRARRICISTVKEHVHAIFVCADAPDRVEFGADVLNRVLRISGVALCAALDEYRLTPVQRDIAGRLAHGECNRLISHSRRTSLSTVKTHVHAIYLLAGVATRHEFAANILKRVLRIAAAQSQPSQWLARSDPVAP